MNLVSIGIFGLIFLSVIAVVSNYAPDNQTVIQSLFDRINCPLPSITGLWNASGVLQYSGATYNYPSVSNQTLTLTCTEVHTLDSFDYAYGSPTIPFAGFPFFVGDFISEILANKLTAFFQLIGFLITPASLNILGYTIADLTGFALMAVIAMYLMCYIAIGALLYKIISPFAGAS